jgi:hypothetical protein
MSLAENTQIARRFMDEVWQDERFFGPMQQLGAIPGSAAPDRGGRPRRAQSARGESG